MRKVFVGGNWKCNLTVSQVQSLVENVYNKLKINQDKIASPVSIHIPYVLQNIQSSVQVSSQNVSLNGMGAFTGEISIEHLKDFNIHWAIIERREYFSETNEIVGKKIARALKNGLNVIGCFGEKLQQRESDQTFTFIQEQLDAFTKELEEKDWTNLVLAYEPVWAIGTGKVATPQQAQEVHAFIREYLKKNVSEAVSQKTRIIYGGSVTDKNCNELIHQNDIDGFLVGGASIKPDFIQIIEICSNK